MDYRFLGQINSPDDVRKLNNDELNVLCQEIRDCIINTVSKNGGHLASNLGAVELTVALHKCFNSPEDTIVFDVGHQCYPHKLLTGRYNQFSDLRKENGISGFMKPEESPHDKFITGHSSTSVASAYGTCVANSLLKNDGFSIAVIGDGALTGGMVYEALNNVRKIDSKLIVILNDNKMSISKNNGALAKHLNSIRTRKGYFKFKYGVERFLAKIPLIGKFLRSFVFNIKLMVKNALYNSNIFESLGFYYMGPVDGHDIEKLCEIFDISKELNRPVLIHTKTVKGKGYAPAEANPGNYHGVSGFDIETGEIPKGKDSFSKVFGEKLCELAENDSKICAITAAMTVGTGLKSFSEKFKDRFFDVGIAEEHAVTFAASLALNGLKPVFAVYSTFLQRGFDQIIHDAAIANIPLTLAVDRTGFVGDDGETHQGLFDVSFLSSIPGVTIYAPATFNELREMLEKRMSNPQGIAAIRYPRGGEPEITEMGEFLGKYTVFGNGETVIVTYGTLTYEALKAKEILNSNGIDVTVLKLNIVNPLSEELLKKLMQFKSIVFFEEGILSGGVAERVGFKLIERGFNGKYKAQAVEEFVKQASVNSQRQKYGLDCDSMVKTVKEVLSFE